METKWKSSRKLKPAVILKDLEDNKKVQDSGGISYEGYFGTFGLDFVTPALTGMIEFPKTLEPQFRENLVRRTIIDVSRNDELDQHSFITHLRTLVRAELSKPENTFHILTSLSIEKSSMKRLSLDGVMIRILPYGFPNKYDSRKTFDIKDRHKGKTTYQYSNTIITVTSRHADAAFSKGMDSLDFARAVWNLIAIPRWEIGPSEWTPINRVRTGPIHTLHKKNGKAATEIHKYWYEPNFVEVRPFNASQNRCLSKNTRWILNQVNECKYKSILKSAMLRYVRALDERDPNIAIIKLWSALESLTSPVQANYDQVVRRVAFLFEDHKILLQVLEQLKEIRNRNVHAGEGIENARATCFFLANCFSKLCLFHARNVDKFATIDDANNFLDLHVNKSALEKRKALIEYALKFRNLE